VAGGAMQTVAHLYAPPGGGLLTYRAPLTNTARFYQLVCDGLSSP
jgi:hypothetical protein